MPERPPATVARMAEQAGPRTNGPWAGPDLAGHRHRRAGHRATVAGLVAIALAHQSEGQLIRLLNVLSGVALGTLVASRRPGNPLGWLMLGGWTPPGRPLASTRARPD
jgi:hypothetical protein